MAHFAPLPLGQLYTSQRSGQDFALSAQETQRGSNSTQPQQGQISNQGPESGRRSMLSSITSRIGGMRERERQASRAVEQEMAQGRRDRLLRDLNRLRDATIGRVPFQYGEGRMFTGNNPDLEAQAQVPNNTIETTSSTRRASTGKSKREKEEGAALFGPNLATYFGSGSSSSGAVLHVAASTGTDSWTTSQRKARLGSRGRARGASLSGLLPDDIGISVTSLPEQNVQRGEEMETLMSEDYMPMAEGIELDTIKRWIDRSVAGGALEIPGVDGAPALSNDNANPLALCSTLQSYVNLKRNTVKLNVFSGSDADELFNQTNSIRSPTLTAKTPSPTHLLQFEYDCASPNAVIQVFARASRKHGSWVSWAATRESLGLPVDIQDGDDVDSRFYAQRGPPPHVLGWPVYANRLKRGFGRPLKAAIALQLEYYAPPKADQSGKNVNEEEEVLREPETPGLDSGRILGEDMPATPPIVSIPISNPFSQLTLPPPPPSATETKEEKIAREKAERETLKLTLVVEALDEDGKPLGEPNLQTTYLRVASLPIRADGQSQSRVDATNVVIDGQLGGHIQDVAIPLEEEREGQEILATTNLDPLSNKATTTTTTTTTPKRIWTLQVEGQEAEIGPHRFQLQELYGLSSRPPPPNQEEHHDHEATEATEVGDTDVSLPALDLSQVQDGNATECLICLSSPPTTLLLPCTHGLCLECAVQLRESVKAVRQTERRRGRRPKRKYACPVCRRGMFRNGKEPILYSSG